MVSADKLYWSLWLTLAIVPFMSPAEGDEARRFVFPELPDSQQRDGYSNVCERLTSGACIDDVSYDEYVGKTGVFVDQHTPVSQVYRSKIFELEVDGERLYFSSLSESDDPLDFASNTLRWYDEVLKEQAMVRKPVVDGSPVRVVSSVGRSPFAWIRVEGVDKPFNSKEWRGVQALLRAQPPESHARLLGLLAHTYVEYDDFEEMVRIQPDPFESALIEIRINWKEVNPRATATIKYSGDDWLFVNRYILLAGEHRFESPVEDFQRDHDTGVWEWRTIPLDDLQQKLVEAILQDGDAKIRFYGNQYYHDDSFGEADRRALMSMLELWKIIGSR